MPELTPKQKKRLKRLAVVADGGELGLISEISDLEDKVDETTETLTNDVKSASNLAEEALKIAQETSKQKGDDGYTPQKGKDYFDGKDYILTPQDKKEIAKSIQVPVVEKVIEKTLETVIKEQPIVTENKIENPFILQGSEIVDRINELQIIPELQIGKEHILGLDEIEKLARQPKGNQYFGGQGVKEVIAGTNITVDNSRLNYPTISSTNQTITLDGDVAGSGTTSITTSLNYSAILSVQIFS